MYRCCRKDKLIKNSLTGYVREIKYQTLSRKTAPQYMIFIYEGYMSKGRPRRFGRYISGDDDIAFVG